jgi:glycosyltransferase involved in cell wall biosynthesis
MVNFTIAIPTYNGADRLPTVLQRLKDQVNPDAISWEVRVIDNNSQDETAAVVQRFQADFPCPLYYCFEPRQGVGYARQQALQTAQGEWVGFLDDDNWPDSDWMTAAWRFAQQHPSVGAIASRVRADYEQEPPTQFRRIQGFLAITDRGSQPRLYEPQRKLLPPGAGLVVRRSVWLAHVPKRTWLNDLNFKRPDGNDCSEDLEALSYIQQSAWEIWYNPAMQITHHIPARRLERQYLLPMFRSIGLSRSVTRLIGSRRWQQPLILSACWLNDLRKVLRHLFTYRMQVKTDLVAACEFELYLGSLISPCYLIWRVITGRSYPDIATSLRKGNSTKN